MDPPDEAAKEAAQRYIPTRTLASAAPSRTHEDYQIGVICALATEKAAMVAMLDETHLKLKKENGDDNEYTLGRIGVHNVVIACLPAGLIGNGPAAIVANNMRRSFPIKFGLMVGVGGGVWSKKSDIRLGDVVVSQPTGTHSGVVQWDFGKMEKDGKFQRTGSLDKPPPVLLHALQELKTFDITDGVNLEESLSLMVRNKPRLGQTYRYQGGDYDRLFDATYNHESDETCDNCNPKLIVQRPVRKSSTPRIHYGNIASGNEVIKHGTTRDKIAREKGVICFEMEAAGLMDNFRCLVIRGICDYADSHKNKVWQPYAAATAAAFARVLLGFIDKQEMVKMLPPFRPLRVLPFGRNKDFVGRQSHLNRLITILHTENTEENCQRVALVGLGGVGKTQIALECAFQLQLISPACSVFWVRASDITSFENAYRDIGLQLKIPGLEDDKADVKRLVKAKLSQESTGKWLMIVDNADDFEIFCYNDKDSKYSGLSEYLPFSALGAILFTTRDREAATRYASSNVIDIDEMDNKESRELFQRSLQNKQLVKDDSGTIKLLELLVNLPLAIMQAAAYLNAKVSTIAEYLKIYNESSSNVIKLLSKDFEDIRRYPGMKNPVATTWLISFQQIQDRNPLAADYMAFMSCIKEQDIPRDLLPPASEFDKEEALGTLKSFGFIKERVSGKSYDMHRLVHTAMQNWLKLKDEWKSLNQRTLCQITSVFPWPQHKNRAVWIMYLPHAQYAIANFDTGLSRIKETKELLGKLLHNLGQCFYIKGKYAEAEAMYRQTLQLRETVLGKEHPDTLATINNLAISLDRQSKYADAEAMHRQTLQLKETVLGKEHPDTLASMNNLALSLDRQGKYADAEAMHRQTLQLKETVLGKEHPDTLASITGLAISLDHQAKYAEAEAMHRQTLQLKETVLGKEHPDTLGSMNNFASSLYRQGKYAEAEAMHQQTLQLKETVLGKEHPDTLASISNSASSLYRQGFGKPVQGPGYRKKVLTEKIKVSAAAHSGLQTA
ncbi:hypothetical protein B0O99DRAFT_746711 [Bisporella sp. PMI_857]|nr:hypothetical protein B0O99DRAFT_746711 [Bisporella sp. PMI_857]